MQSQRLIYEKFQATDFDLYYQIVSNPDVMKYITGRPITGKQLAKAKFRKLLSINKASDIIGVYLVRLKATNTFIGLSKVVMYGKNEAEIGYSLLPPFWGVGYGSEISHRMTDHAISIKSIHRIIAFIDPENGASKRILEKCNFGLEKEFTMDGLPAALYVLKPKKKIV